MAVLIGAVPAALVGGIGSILVADWCWKAFPDLLKVQRLDRHI